MHLRRIPACQQTLAENFITEHLCQLAQNLQVFVSRFFWYQQDT